MDVSCCFVLHSLDLLDSNLLVGVPHQASIFQDWADKASVDLVPCIWFSSFRKVPSAGLDFASTQSQMRLKLWECD